jgi:hypothetical protein
MEFIFSELPNVFKNIEIISIDNSDCYKAEVRIIGSRILIAELYFYPEQKEWRVIKDNFPHQRKRYEFNLPTKTVQQFQFYLEQIGIQLINN